jgi:tetratricopeptide (TPR) repeat protein
MITVYDSRGRELSISRQEWAEKVLPGSLRDAWDDADALYGQIVTALQDGLEDRLLEAAKRLSEIDSDAQRSAVVLAIVLMKTGELDEAEEVLRAHITRHGETGVVLTNLAKVYAERNDKRASETLLRRSLALDPNQDNGLDWWGAIHHERGGKDAFLKAMEDIAGEPGSWRPQLWIARHHLQDGRVDEAIGLYRHAIGLAGDSAEALMMISGDLGKAGRIQEMLDLVLPVYVPSNHGPHTGLNLLQGLLEAGRTREGRELLSSVQRLGLPPFAERLADLERRFMETEKPRKVPGPVRAVGVPITGPIWTRGLGDPKWLLPPRADAAPRIAFFSLADTTLSGNASQLQTESDTGRLTRSLPLYLAEALLFKTTARTFCVIPVIKGEGPVVSGRPWPLATVLGCCPDELAPDIVITGVLGMDGTGHHAELVIWGAPGREELGRLRIPARPGFKGLALRAEKELIGFLEKDGRARTRRDHGVFVSPEGKLQDHYLLGVGQLFTQVLAANKFADPSKLWNERAMLETYFQLVDEMPHAAVPKIMVICGVLACVEYDSPLATQYGDALLQFVNSEADPRSPVRMLSPYVLRKLGRDEGFAEAYREALKVAEGRYEEWLKSLAGE